MRVVLAASLCALGCAPLCAPSQTPAAGAPTSYTWSDPLGFSFAVPADWEVVDSRPSLPQVREKATQKATSEDEKKSVACAQVGLTARHGDPNSVILVEALPYDCFGQQFTQDDLPTFGAGVAEGLKQNFDIGDPQQASYALGSHHFWIERAHANPKGQPDRHFTIEIACTVLKKASVCWMALAADDTALAVFEHGAVTLEDDPPAALVPAAVFKQ